MYVLVFETVVSNNWVTDLDVEAWLVTRETQVYFQIRNCTCFLGFLCFGLIRLIWLVLICCCCWCWWLWWIIHQIVYDMPYDSACAYVGVQPLSARRSELGRRFFRSVTISDSCLWPSSPPSSPTTWFGNSFPASTTQCLPIPRNKTNKYHSFIYYALAKYNNLIK